MKDYQESAIKELEKLNQKIDKMERFIASEKFSAVDDTEKTLLEAQLDYMKEYAKVLDLRIKRF